MTVSTTFISAKPSFSVSISFSILSSPINSSCPVETFSSEKPNFFSAFFVLWGKTFRLPGDFLGNKSLKRINKHVNYNLKHLFQWLRSNKILLNASKANITIFKYKQTIIYNHKNFRVSGQKIDTTTCVKYLAVCLNNFLIWETHFTNFIRKLNR